MAKRPAKRTAVPPTGPRPIYILSDSTGNLGRHVVTALLTQFPPDTFKIHSRNFLRTPEQVGAALDELPRSGGIVFHAVVSLDSKRLIEKRCRAIKLPVRDLTGPLMEFLSDAVNVKPVTSAQFHHHIDAAYHRRVRALEFTLEHDDGLGLETLGEADIILVGVSRTSKTPTSVYLAQLGYRVANIALAMQVAPPRQLLELNRRNVVGLVIQPRVLAEIRARRQQQWRMEPTSYTDPTEVAREVSWSRELFTRQNWPILDITNQALEETAARVVQALNLQPA
jgi:[pyruvate, water dikinase]-phosphate phosphotransferase / [pyruvate, water dikinase] kinase